ncbi:MAG: AAA family ATPase [Gammaproteobacteria bacterium]|nr:AAA family ATPase [Gammaproteobacteria bacterium]
MYLSFFGLNEKPFSITPDPRYLFLSERHAEAMAHLLYGIREAGGFIQLTGEVGTGKTTIVRSLLAQTPENTEIALILNPRMSPPEFLLTLCEELGIGVPDEATRSLKDLVDILNTYLLRAHAAGKRVVLVVDEAQNLAPEVLEQVRLLTNLETNTQKLLQIILIGQPELRELLDRLELRQLAQRITGRYHLDPLSAPETAAYVRHRLRVAGATSEIFSRRALQRIHRLSGGVPRLINILCDRALLGGYSLDRHQVTGPLVRQAGVEVFGRRAERSWPLWAGVAAVAALLGAAGVVFWRFGPSLPAISTARPHVQRRLPSVPPPTHPPPSHVAARAVSASVSLQGLLGRYGAQATAAAAYARLLALWGLKDPAGGPAPCQQAAQHGLVCVQGQGSLGELRLYNRPAILLLTDAAGQTYHVVLQQLAPSHATVDLGPTPARVRRTALSRAWLGRYALLWRPADGRLRTLSTGMSGAGVRWLRRSLQRLEGMPASSDPGTVYDSGLVRLVRRFQRSHGLAVDGIAGVQTQMAVSGALPDPHSPLLAAQHNGG